MLTAALTTAALVFVAELPDKTLVATLVLATRYRPRPVWVGVSLAFLVQTLVAVAAGGLVATLPRRPVLAVTAVLFAVGAYVLLRGEEDEEVEEGQEVAAAAPVPTARMVGSSFAVLFAAEWGDFSQLLTAGLAARFDQPVAVFAGAWGALVLIAGCAVVAGRALLRVVPLGVVRRVAGVLFGLLAVATAVEAIRGG